MENKTIGTFLSALRRANGMTQQEVADKLNVSNKTVSKWERDEGCPEIMMLPAIAELYSVTVDEILRGERIIKDSQTEKKEHKSEERIKYLAEMTKTKFSNNAIVSIVLGVVANILTYTIGDIVYDYNFLWVGYAIILLLVAVSVIVILISFNNLISGLNYDDNKDFSVFETTIQGCIKHITIVIILVVVALLGMLLCILMDGPSFLFGILPVTILIGTGVGYLIRSLLYKKYNIQEKELSPEQETYRKKHIKTTSVILSLVVVISIIMPFISGLIDYHCSLSIFNYSAGINYQFATREEAETEYYKIKGFVTDSKELYKINWEGYNEPENTYTLELYEITGMYEKKDDGYCSIGPGYLYSDDITTKSFTSADEMEKFKSEYVYNEDGAMLEDLQRGITFDDESLTVSWFSEMYYMNGVYEFFPGFLILGSCISIVTIIISVILYYKKKNKLS